MPKKALVEGQVVLRNNQALEVEYFEAEFVLSDDIEDIGQARIVIQKGLLESYLKKAYKNYKRWRECQVVSLEETDETQNKEDYALEDLLLEATKLNCVPENIDNYKRSDYKAKALQKAIDAAKERNAKLEAKKRKDAVQDKGYVD